MKLSTLPAVEAMAREHDKLVDELRKLRTVDLLLATFEGGGNKVSLQLTNSEHLFGVMRLCLKSDLEKRLEALDKGLAELGVEADVKP